MKKPKVYLRELLPADAELYVKISWGESIHSYVNFMEAHTIEEAISIISLNTHKYKKIYGVFTKSSNQLVGALITSCFEPEKELVVHYFIGEKFQRCKFAYEAILVLSSLMRKQTFWKVDKLIFEIRKSNTPSIKLQQALGSTLVEENNRYVRYELIL